VIGIFKQRNPVNILLLAVIGGLLKFPAFVNPHVPVPQSGDGILYLQILKVLQNPGNSFPIIYPSLAFVFLFIQSISLTWFINTQRMMSHSNYLPGISYMLITSFFPEWNYFSAPLLINSILLFILATLFKSYNQLKVKAMIYNVGLALGLAYFLFVPSIIFTAWVFLALMVMRPFRINEWLICILGIITPYYFYGIYLFLTDQWNWHKLLFQFSVGIPFVKQSAWLAGSAFLTAVPFFIGGYYVQDNLRRILINVRKGWSLLLLYLLAAIIAPFVNSGTTFENWMMVAIPLAAFHAYAYLYSVLRIVPLILFWLSVAFVIAYQYYGPGW
jgi:hypothetical protein